LDLLIFKKQIVIGNASTKEPNFINVDPDDERGKASIFNATRVILD
jgi:hypothetical protein